MNKGLSMPLILILVLIILLPLSYLFFSKEMGLFTPKNVKGATTEVARDPGLSFTVVSSGTWDLSQYLCATLKECSSSVQSGKRIGSIGGGKTSAYEVYLKASEEWKQYSFLKIVVRPGWGTDRAVFSVSDLGSVEGTIRETFKDGSNVMEAVIVPLSEVNGSFFRSAVFTD
jgi:hypothetical protein